MIKQLFYISIMLTIISWLAYFAIFVIPFKIYYIEINTNSKNIYGKLYRDLQDYMNSIDKESKDYTTLSTSKKENLIIAEKNYSRIILSVIESKDFLNQKLKPKLTSKGYQITIIPIDERLYMAYLSNFILTPKQEINSNIIEEINEKYFDYFKSEKLVDYIQFLGKYFDSSTAKKVAETQFFIAKNFIINFTFYPYTTSKRTNIYTIKVENISNQKDLAKLLSIVRKYNENYKQSSFFEYQVEDKAVNLNNLMKIKQKNKDKK